MPQNNRDDLIRRCIVSGMDEASAVEFAEDLIEADRSEADRIYLRLMAEAEKALRTIRAGLGG
ncbi:hypothetical protein [Methylocystis parvus]|uniref:hypothetical protein n=1 Tax=Methylocystis parvus TaxID=134 RepID=UPI003C779E7E